MFLSAAYANDFVVDDLGKPVFVSQPVQRIISLAPHLTEVLFTLDVGEDIVGTVKYSDYPDAALDIPRLGDAFSLNIEAVLGMRPDIIFAWHTGGLNPAITRLMALGVPVFVSNPTNLDNIASSFERVGKLIGKAELGRAKKAAFLSKLAALKRQPKHYTKVFFQISGQDLYTVNDTHIMAEALRHCGGQSVFADLPTSVGLVGLETVLERNPDLILIAQSAPSKWQRRWQAYPQFAGKVKVIQPNLISRPSYRMLAGIEAVCKIIEEQEKLTISPKTPD